jgi:hypothetical protein
MSKKVAIMQPYFLPYIGYFQLVNSVDEFIIYDNIQYTKKGWINRNRILDNGSDRLFTISIKKDSDYLDVVDRKLSESWDKDRKKLLNSLYIFYHKAPCFKEAYNVIEECLLDDEDNLFTFILNGLNKVNEYLNIKTPIVVSSSIDIDHSLKSQDKVLAICKAREATTYINAIGGMDLYSKTTFELNNIKLKFIKSQPITYTQFENTFVPWLSIVDVMMFNSKDMIQEYLNSYTLL